MARYGEYLVIEQFEGGSQGRTFLAERDLVQKRVVLKIVSYFKKKDKERADMEIALMKRLESPFTVRLICTFQDRADMCMILEYCERGDLRKVIIDLQKLSEAERVQIVWELLAQISLSLNHLHSNDVVHRDFKPENIFIMADGSSRLGDFGLVKELTDKDYGTAVGTKPYMAPEVFMFQKMDKHSDMFSLGIVVCEMLTGKHPFDGGSDQATIQKIIRNDVAKLPSFVPKEMLELVTSMINPNPSSRPQIKQILEQSTIKMYIRLQDGKRKAEELVHQLEIRVHEQDERIRVVEQQKKNAEKLTRKNEQQKIQADERARLAEQQKIQAEERARVAEQQKIQAEERARLAEQQQRESIEHNRVVEQWAQTAEERAKVAEGLLRTKETENIRLQQEIDRLRSSSVPVQSAQSKQQSQSYSHLPPPTQPKQIQIVQQTPIQSSRGVQQSAVSVQQSPNQMKLKFNIPDGDKGRIQRSSFIHANDNDDYSTITVDPIINRGVARFDAIFNGHEGKKFSLGIAESSQIFEKGYGPDGY
ncbi:MAG: putative protein kinase, partial [Streblomastix strix]